MFAKEGYSTMILAVFLASAIALAGYFWGGKFNYIAYILALLLVGIIFYFFRDPERPLPEKQNLIVAPADGYVVNIKEVHDPTYLKGPAKEVNIFLSLFDVHVNRVPITGKVEYVKYHPGKYLAAWNEKASSENERADFGILHPSGNKVFFRQITGLVARRIVYDLNIGDHVQAGERFGMMKFGSRMDILVPPDVEIEVKKGQHTTGGVTILGRIPEQA